MNGVTYWAVFWPALAFMAATCVIVLNLIIVVAVPVRCVLHRNGGWLDVATVAAASILAVAGVVAAGTVLGAVGLA